MFSAVSSFVNKRRRGLTVLATLAGGAYLVTNYARQRFAELTERLMLDRSAKENLRRRFQQNQEDCAFTIQALLPTLSNQVIEELDVESLTTELQRRAEETKRKKEEGQQQHETNGKDDSSPVQVLKLNESGESSEAASVQGGEINGHADGVVTESTASLVHVEKAQNSKTTTEDGETAAEEAAQVPLPAEDMTAENGIGHATMQDFAVPVGVNGQHQQQVNDKDAPNGVSELPKNGEQQEPMPDPRSKSELWQAVKILTFQRTVTALYLLSLLALQTHIQLNLLGRHSYVSSIYERSASTSSLSSDSLASTFSDLEEGNDELDALEGAGLFSDENHADKAMNGGDVKGKKKAVRIGRRGVDPLIERQYLTFSWWFIQRGWRQVNERVREATEEVLESVALKTPYGSQDLSKLLLEIRRKVEYEDTGAVHSFASVLFPSTHSEEAETLSQSGLATTVVDPTLRFLLDETKDFIDSADFSTVLRSMLDKSFALLTSSLGDTFAPPPIPNTQQTARFEEVQERKVKLAALLPALARSTHTILNSHPNEYTELLLDNRELQEISAVVYSSFSLED